jgi:hypothetical protein
MRPLNAVASGLVGATTLTLLHELARRVIPEAPRVDVLGMRAIAAALRAGGTTPPPSGRLYWWALAGDLVSNSLYYSFAAIGAPKRAVWRGGLLGLGAGAATVALPPMAGLGTRPQARTLQTALLTVLWYFIGGLAAGMTARTLAQGDERAAYPAYERDAARATHDHSL